MKKILITIMMIGAVLTFTACSEKEDVVIVLTSSGYEPYELIDTDGNLTGFDIELMEALAEEMQITIEWKDVDFDGIIASLQSGQADIAIAGITPTATRALVVDFSDVYYNSDSGLENYLVTSNELTISSLEDLENLVVGAQLGTIQADLITELSEIYNFTVDLRNSNTQIIEEIASNRIDVLVVENIVASSILEANESLIKTILNYTTDSISGNAIAFSKNSEYPDQFNEALLVLKDNGTLDELIEKWFTN